MSSQNLVFRLLNKKVRWILPFIDCISPRNANFVLTPSFQESNFESVRPHWLRILLNDSFSLSRFNDSWNRTDLMIQIKRTELSTPGRIRQLTNILQGHILHCHLKERFSVGHHIISFSPNMKEYEIPCEIMHSNLWTQFSQSR